jgi:hypothetical protein
MSLHASVCYVGSAVVLSNAPAFLSHVSSLELLHLGASLASGLTWPSPASTEMCLIVSDHKSQSDAIVLYVAKDVAADSVETIQDFIELVTPFAVEFTHSCIPKFLYLNRTFFAYCVVHIIS